MSPAVKDGYGTTSRGSGLNRLINRLFPFFLIVSLGTICYSSSFDASFQFDDYPSIVENKAIQDIRDIASLWKFHPSRVVAYYTFALNFHFHALRLFGYHLINFLIHLFTAFTIYGVVILLFDTPELKKHSMARHGKNMSLIVALVFVCHPVATQAVTYIVQRIASLAALFYLVSVHLYLRARVEFEREKPSVTFYIGSIFSALLAMFTKEIAVTLPVCILALEFYFFSPSWNKLYRRFSFLWPHLLTLPIVPLTYVLGRRGMIEQFGLGVETVRISRADYLFTQIHVIRDYIALLFFPLRQSIDYDYPVVHRFLEPSTLFSFLLLVCFILMTVLFFKRQRLISFGIFWFFISLSVESTVIPIQDVFFEHRLYLPSFGLFVAAVAAIFHFWGTRVKALLCFFSLVMIALSLAAVNRNIVWREKVLLWHDAAKNAPKKARVYLNRGVGYSDLNKLDLAMQDYKTATALDRTLPQPYLNRGIIYTHRAEYESAVSEFNVALSLQPSNDKAYLNRGLAYLAWGKFEQAYGDIYEAVRLKPENPLYVNALGAIYLRIGKYDLARLAFTRAIALFDTYATAYRNRGKTHRLTGQLNAAIEDLNRAAELDPDMAETFYQRGLVYVQLSDYEKAAEDFSRAVKRDPQFVKAYHNRGMVYHRLGRDKQALGDLNMAIALDSSIPKLYESRGKVNRSLGRQHQAGTDFERARELEEQEKRLTNAP